MFRLDGLYLRNLEKFVGKKIPMRELKNGIEFGKDPEVQQRWIEKSKNHYAFQIIERGQLSWEDEYNNISLTEMKRKLAIRLQGSFGKSIDFAKTSEFREILNNDLEKVEQLMKKYVGEGFYSINNPQIDKINLESLEANLYNIYLLHDDGERSYREQKAKEPFAFARFYNSAISLKERLKRIDEYQKVFNDRLTKNEIEEILFNKAQV